MFKLNRDNLAKTMTNNSLLIIFSGDTPYRSADQKYRFTPNRNFYYLTGIKETNIILTILKKEDVITETLYIQRENKVMEKWVGKTIDKEEALSQSNISDIRYLDEFKIDISSYMDRLQIEKIYLDFERQSITLPSTLAQDQANELKVKYPYISIENIHPSISKLRQVKHQFEIDKIKRAIDITKEGIESMAKNIKPGMRENEVEAYFDFTIKKLGASNHAFNTICASGKNATILHYEDNNQVINDNELILFDLGAEYDYYCADISRTIPINGQFTPRQKQIYTIVLDALKAVEKSAKPNMTLKDLNDVAKETLAKGCLEIGLIKEENEIYKYYYHGVSHSLGLDTHDVWNYNSKLEENAVITNEPGLYIEEESIGIRLENDLLITKDGCINLSKHIPIEIYEIEEIMN